MGKSLLAHILYSCHKINFNIDNFFSSDGNAHAVGQLNNTNLIAQHYTFNYDTLKHNNDLTCLIEIIPDGLYNILRLKMSYSKWDKDYPTIDNFSKFFKLSYEKTPQDFLESLTLKYLAIINNAHQQHNTTQVIKMSDVINNRLYEVQDIVCKTLDWEWDQTRSNKFNTAMVDANQLYLTWFNKIRWVYYNCCNLNVIEYNLEFWEQAAIIAYYCYEHNINPLELPWYDVGCFFDKTNINFIKTMEKHHGKTIRY
jgi:hypothetical protein